MERRPSKDRHSWNGPSYVLVEGNEKSNRIICEVWDDGGYDGPSEETTYGACDGLSCL